MFFYVVVKETKYENWLISDIAAIRRMPRRFQLSAQQIRSIQPNKADNVDAVRILKRAAIGSAYDKVRDAMRIMSYANPMNVAKNSRSFRRLLRLIDCPSYVSQSKIP
jgi:hypothetical protein